MRPGHRPSFVCLALALGCTCALSRGAAAQTPSPAGSTTAAATPAAAPAPAPTAASSTAVPGAPAAPAAVPLTLETAVQHALARAESVRIAELELQGAEARIDKARAFFLPDLTLGAAYTRYLDERAPVGDTVPDSDVLGASVSIGVTLFDGRGFPLYASAERERDARKLEVAEVRRTLSFDAASAFLATLSQERVEEAARTRVELAGKSYAQAKSRFDSGLSSSNDVTQTELELSAAERDLTSAHAEVLRRRLDLGYFLARDVDEPLALPESMLAAAEAAGLAAEGKLQSPPAPGTRLDVAALRARAESQEELADEPSWRWVPSLSASAAQRFSNARDWAETTIGLALTWALWDGGERNADRSERLAAASATRLSAEALERSAKTEIKQAVVALQRGARVLSQATRTAEVARRNGSETGELYRQGLATALAVADASSRLFSAEVELARARYDLAVGLLSLRLALGLDPFGKEPVR
jgi:outer membrane protein TolC